MRPTRKRVFSGQVTLLHHRQTRVRRQDVRHAVTNKIKTNSTQYNAYNPIGRVRYLYYDRRRFFSLDPPSSRIMTRFIFAANVPDRVWFLFFATPPVSTTPLPRKRIAILFGRVVSDRTPSTALRKQYPWNKVALYFFFSLPLST